jgi:cytochrome oxidase assembly protein ShyY1
LLTLAAMTLFVRLGLWQLDRAAEAQRLATTFGAATSAAPVDLITPSGAPVQADYAHARVRGRFITERGYLRDEQMREGRLGVEAYAVFAANGVDAWLLVDRGWVAKTRTDGAETPLPPLSDGEVELRGIHAPFPGNGLRVGGNALPRQTTWPKLTLAIDADEIAADLGHPLLPGVLLLDAHAASGFVRSWQPTAMPPERHRAYALQWFAFAIAALAIFVLLHFRKVEN